MLVFDFIFIFFKYQILHNLLLLFYSFFLLRTLEINFVKSINYKIFFEYLGLIETFFKSSQDSYIFVILTNYMILKYFKIFQLTRINKIHVILKSFKIKIQNNRTLSILKHQKKGKNNIGVSCCKNMAFIT